jgi:hypothetical protein
VWTNAWQALPWPSSAVAHDQSGVPPEFRIEDPEVTVVEATESMHRQDRHPPGCLKSTFPNGASRMQIRWKSANKKTIQNFTGIAIFVDLCFGIQKSAGVYMVRYPEREPAPIPNKNRSNDCQFQFGELDKIIKDAIKREPDGTEFLLVLEAPLYGLFKDGNPISRAVDSLASFPSFKSLPWHKSAGATMYLSAMILLECLEQKLKKIRSRDSVVTIHLAEGFVSFKGKKQPRDPGSTTKSAETIELESSLRSRYDEVVESVRRLFGEYKGGAHFADTLILRAIFEQARITISSQSYLVGEIIEPEKDDCKYVVKGLSRPPAVLRYDPSPWMIPRKAA